MKRTVYPSSASRSPDIAFAASALGQRLRATMETGSASHRAIAEFLLRNQVRVTALGIEELAGQCGVSTATISRFARDSGFKNFAALRAAVAHTLQSLLHPVDKLRSNVARKGGTGAPAINSLDSAAANLGATGMALEPAVMSAIVRELARARAVHVLGFGLSSHLAGMLALHLQPFCQQVIEVAGQGGTEVAAGHLANLTAKDVLVVISFPRYGLDVIRLSNFARERGARIVAITDAPASPLAALADHVLYAACSHPILPSSASAAVAVIEALVVSLLTSNKANVDKAARLTEAIAAYLTGAEAEAAGGLPRRRPRTQKNP